MSRFRRPALGASPGYVPGEQPAGTEAWVKLNTNEAPLPPSPSVVPAVTAAAAGLRRYPDPFGEPLRGALAAHHGVEPEQILVGNGADDILDCCFRAFCGAGDTVVHPAPTYSLLPVLARQHGAVAVELPIDAAGRPPARLAGEPGRLRVIVNPNAPTGTWLAPEELEALLAGAPGVVVVDEAYCDFAPASCVPALARHHSWLVVRTFSKSHALAGLRVGYAVGSAEVIADLYSVKASYPVGACAIAGAAAALADRAHHRALVAAVVAERERLAAGLQARGWRVMPSQANFVFGRPPSGGGRATMERLRDRRILVRHLDSGPPWEDWLRITVGEPQDTGRLLAALGPDGDARNA